MADITVYNQGQVSNEGMVNWRGDQTCVTPGDQSIFDSSSVKLAELGSRKVVGDRVFRYSLALATIGAGDVAEDNGTPLALIDVTAGGTNPADGKSFSFYFATTIGADVYAGGYVFAQSGTAANMGLMYRVRTHSSVATTSVGTLFLEDPLKIALNVTDKYTLRPNPYKNLTQCTNGTNVAMGVAPISVTTGDYFWLQTWGPAAVKCAAVAAGLKVVPLATGQVGAPVATTAAQLGISMQALTASERGMVFLMIAP